MKSKHTIKKLGDIGKMLRKGLQEELKEQQHNATGKLSRGLKYHIKDSILSIYSSVGYWNAVNNPKFARTPSYNAIASWVRVKRGIESTPAAIMRIYAKLIRKGYGKPYVYWTAGNSLKRTDFSGYTARKYKEKVVQELAPSIGKDVASMIRSQIRKNNPKAIVS